MRFKQKGLFEFIATLISATVGITLALNHFGVWSLVIMQLITAFITAVLYRTIEGGHGRLIFNKSSFKTYYKFGVNTSLASVLNSIFDNIYQAILAKYFSTTTAGLFYQAKKLQDIPVGIVKKLTQSVLFAGLSRIQDNESEFKKIYSNFIRLFTVLVGFISLTLFLFSKEIVQIILGDQWLDSTFFLQILSVVGYFHIQEIFNRLLFKIYDDTKYILYLEFIKKGIQSVSIIIGLYLARLDVLIYGLLITTILSYFINYYFTYKRYSFLGMIELFTVCKVVLINIIIIFVLTRFIHFNTSVFDYFSKALCMLFLFFVGVIFFGIIQIKRDIKLLIKK